MKRESDSEKTERIKLENQKKDFKVRFVCWLLLTPAIVKAIRVLDRFFENIIDISEINTVLILNLALAGGVVLRTTYVD